MFTIKEEGLNTSIQSNDDRYILIMLPTSSIRDFHKWLLSQETDIVFTVDSGITENSAVLIQSDISELIPIIESVYGIKPDRFITIIKENIPANKKIKLKKVLGVRGRDLCEDDIFKKVSSLSDYQIKDICKLLIKE